MLWPGTGSGGQPLLTVNFDHDTRVVTSPAGVTDFTVMPRGGASFSPSDDSDTVPGAADSWDQHNVEIRVTESVLTTPGDTRFLGYVVGRAGTITTEGEMTIVTPNTRMNNNSQIAQGLNLYVQGDINLSSYRERHNSYGEIDFKDWSTPGGILAPIQVIRAFPLTAGDLLSSTERSWPTEPTRAPGPREAAEMVAWSW